MPMIFRAVMSAAYITGCIFLFWRYMTSSTNQGFNIGASIACIILAIMTINKKLFPLDFAGALLTLACIFSAIGLYSGYDESGLSGQDKSLWVAAIVALDSFYLCILCKYKHQLRTNK